MPLTRKQLRPGTTVTVKSWEEITSTLDENGTLEGIPLQAEMRKFCGKRLRILDDIDRMIVEGSGLRAVKDIILLDGARCEGESHSGCRRHCMLFFKPEWLTISGEERSSTTEDVGIAADGPDPGEELQPCHGQSCVLLNASTPLKYRHLRQYTKGINWPMFVFLSGRNLRWYMGRMWHALIGHREPEPVPSPKTPVRDSPSLSPGDVVKVKSNREILATLNRRSRYRGLAFVGSMLKYCGGTYRVLDRVSSLVDEKSNKLREVSDAVILEDVVCTGELYGGCPRRCYWLWREAWLEKLEPGPLPSREDH